MSRFKNFDHYSEVFRNNGLDLLDRDAHGRANRVSMREWLEAGQTQLKGVIDDGVVQFRDTISTSDITPWLPQVFERNVIEAAEPLLVLTSLFTKAAYEAGQMIEFPAIGAVAAFDVGEGDSYPEVRVQESGATVTAKVGKSGVAFKITEEAMNRSRFDIVGIHLRACAAAMARHKEGKVADMITNLGTIMFDNLDPTNSLFGVTHGRGLSGAANGSVILDDLFDSMAQVMLQGFTPDTLIMNPLTWIMFMKDPVLRAITLAGGNQVWYGGYTGNPAMAGNGSPVGVSGGQAVVPGENAAGLAPSGNSTYNQQLTSAPQLSDRWPWPMRIVVSPWMPYDPSTKRTDIVIADGRQLGLYIEEYSTKVEEWADISIDSRKYKLRESYCFHILNEGLGVGVLKNVKVVANQVTLPAQATQTVSGSISEIPPGSAV